MLQMGAKTSDARIVVVEALLRLNNEAIALDRSGKIVEAIAKYISCTIQLQNAMGLAMPSHSENQRNLMEHLHEIVNRIAHLTGLRPGQVSTVPVEHHITKELKLEWSSEWRRQDPSIDAPCQGAFIKRALSNVPGVRSIDVNETAMSMTIVHDPRRCHFADLLIGLNIETMNSRFMRGDDCVDSEWSCYPTLSDLLKNYPLPEEDRHICTGDHMDAGADKRMKGKSNKNFKEVLQCQDCWFPKPPLCPKCSKKKT